MLEITLAIVVCATIAKIASADGWSPIIWFCVTFVLCLAAVAIPLPYLRFVLAGVLAFIGMFACKAMANRPA